MHHLHGRLERRREQNKRWRLRYPEKKRAENAAWRAANPDYKWKAGNASRVSEYNATYWREHPGLRRIHRLRRRARIIGNGGSHTIREWLDKCALLGNICVYCGESKPLTVDHKIPVARGGTDDIANVVPACRVCNVRKNKKTAQEFLGLTA